MSYHLFSKVTRTARKVHHCIWCAESIPAGSKYEDERSVYDGRHQKHRWHPECVIAAQEWFSKEGEEFTPYENPRGQQQP